LITAGQKTGRFFTGCLLMLLMAVVVLGPMPARAQAEQAREYQIKAAFIYNFFKFIDWPETPLSDTPDTISICILGKDPFGDIFAPIEGKTVKNKKLAIKRVSSPGEIGSCQILFVCPSEQERLGPILASTCGKSILTVSDIKDFARQGGMVGFFSAENTVGFAINLKATERSGLKMSSKLLEMATVIADAPAKDCR